MKQMVEESLVISDCLLYVAIQKMMYYLTFIEEGKKILKLKLYSFVCLFVFGFFFLAGLMGLLTESCVCSTSSL